MTDARLQKLVEIARQKGISEAAVREAVKLLGLQIVEDTVRKSTKMARANELEIGQKAKAPAPSFWPGDTAHKAITVEIPPDLLEKARRLVNITDPVWLAIQHQLTEQQIGDLLEDALFRAGYEGLAGVKSKRNVFWGNWE